MAAWVLPFRFRLRSGPLYYLGSRFKSLFKERSPMPHAAKSWSKHCVDLDNRQMRVIVRGAHARRRTKARRRHTNGSESPRVHVARQPLHPVSRFRVTRVADTGYTRRSIYLIAAGSNGLTDTINDNRCHNFSVRNNRSTFRLMCHEPTRPLDELDPEQIEFVFEHFFGTGSHDP